MNTSEHLSLGLAPGLVPHPMASSSGSLLKQQLGPSDTSVPLVR